MPPARAVELLDRISDGSLQRLVFLVRPREGSVCFDITSLKEFMAAEAVMSGPDDDVRQRLETLGPATYWRNVFLFAVGKCFVEREHMLDMIVSLCAGLNEERVGSRILGDDLAGQAARIVCWGSRLALDVLTDGTARQYPEYELRLIKIAIELVKFGDVEAFTRLAAIYHDDLQDSYRAAIADRLGQSSFWSQVGGWYVLMGLAERDVDWATEELNTKWPKNVTQQRILLFGRGRVALSKWWLTKWFEVAPKLPPLYGSHYFLERTAYQAEKLLPEPWQRIYNFVTRHHRAFEVSNRSTWSDVITSFSLTPSHIGPECLKAMAAVKFEHNDWFPYIAGARFGDDPSAKNLAQELRWLSIHWDPVQRASFWNMPWPLAACLFEAKSKKDLAQIADLASSGKLGDVKEWQTAEKRWRNVGVSEDDILAVSERAWLFDATIFRVGFPLGACAWSTRSSGKGLELQSLLGKLHSLPSGKLKAWLASIIIDLLNSPSRFRWQGLPSGEDLRELLTLASPMRTIRGSILKSCSAGYSVTA